MGALIAVVVVLLGAVAVTAMLSQPALRQAKRESSLAEQRTRALEAAARARARGKPGLAEEHEATAEALLRRIQNDDEGA